MVNQGSMPIAASLTEAATSLVLRGFLACSLVHFNVPQPCHRETNMSHIYIISLLHRWKAAGHQQHRTLGPISYGCHGQDGGRKRGPPQKKISKKESKSKTATKQEPHPETKQKNIYMPRSAAQEAMLSVLGSPTGRIQRL